MPGNSSMKYKIKTIPHFYKALKRLVKKYALLKQEYVDLLDSLEVEPNQGANFGNNFYKVRIAIASKGKGKSGGAKISKLV